MKLRKESSVIFIFILFCFSCKETSENTLLNSSFEKYKQLYFRTYVDVYSASVDSIESWLTDSIESTQMATYFPFQIDSVFIFNNDSTRMFTTINFSSSPLKNDIADMIREFGGAKIQGKWYFFFGASMVVPREMFGDKVFEPLSFERLSEVAHEQMYPTITKDYTGQYHASEQFFINAVMNPRTYGCTSCDTKEEIDSMIVAWCYNERQKKLDPVEIARIKAEMAASRKPLEPRRTWFGLGGYRKEDIDNPRYE